MLTLIQNLKSLVKTQSLNAGVRTLAVPHNWESPFHRHPRNKAWPWQKHWCIPYHLTQSSMGAGTLNLGDSVFLYTGISGLIPTRNRLKFLTFHWPFCFLLREILKLNGHPEYFDIYSSTLDETMRCTSKWFILT